MNADCLNEHKEVFLKMELKKGSFSSDENGDFIFDVEASNENLDFEGQRVLQRALMKSKDYFLSNGVIDKDHLSSGQGSDGKLRRDESFVIGEPIEVYTDGNSTRVKGRLYKSNKYAQEFIKLLRDGSTRVKASVGGLIPKVLNGDVVSVLWNNLALTLAPVNPTVGPAVALSKSLTSAEFVKALQAGYGTDAAMFTGGRALQKEEVGNEKVNLVVNDETAIESLVGAIIDGDVEDLEEAEEFLNGFGISKAIARDVIREIVEKRKEFLEVLPMAKSNLWESATERLKKALGGKPKDDDVDPDELEQGTDGDDDGDDDVEDATPVLKALAGHIEKLEESSDLIAKSLAALVEQNTQSATLQKSIGESLLAVMERTEQIAQTPAPRKAAISSLEALQATLAKGGFGGGTGAAGVATGQRHRQFTHADLDEAKDILCKAVAENKLTTLEAARAETQINKSILNPAAQVDAKFISILLGGKQAAQA
jgi:hypothetical protein